MRARSGPDPGLDRAAATSIARRLDQAATALRGDGVPVHWVRALALPAEESLLCVLDAESAEQVVAVSDVAGLAAGHVQEAIAVDRAT